MAGPLRSLLNEPRSPAAPPRVWRDWLLVAAVLASAGIEAAARFDDMASPFAFLPVALLPLALFTAALLWRRTRPLLAVAIIFGPMIAVSLTTIALGVTTPEIWTGAWIVILGYSLLRWGSGREIAAGVGIMLGAAALGTAADYTNVGDAVGGMVFLLFPAAVGLAVRWQSSARTQKTERIMVEERTQIARDLHDTVAHHVSAIAVQAQAGRVLARTGAPEATEHTLEVIAEEASRALVEMRSILGLLRTEGSGPKPSVRRGIADLRRLESAGGRGTPFVTISLSGDFDLVPESMGAAVYRLAQESVTNAIRHARKPTRVDVNVTVGPDAVRLSVVDDGDPIPTASTDPGFGLIGMRERVELLGGSFTAGPEPKRGWAVRAELPLTPTPADHPAL